MGGLGMGMMRSNLLVLIVLAVGWNSASAAEPIYLRCTHANPMPNEAGRYMILTINPDQQQILFNDYGKDYANSTKYTLEQMDAATIKGSATHEAQRGANQLIIDRVSGRTTMRFDATEQADTVWNEKKRQIGGFDLKPEEKLWLSAALNCQPTKPVF